MALTSKQWAEGFRHHLENGTTTADKTDELVDLLESSFRAAQLAAYAEAVGACSHLEDFHASKGGDHAGMAYGCSECVMAVKGLIHAIQTGHLAVFRHGAVRVKASRKANE